jgi:hypothetical protein
MGLCTRLKDEQAERRSRDTEEFNPWTQNGGIKAYEYDTEVSFDE